MHTTETGGKEDSPVDSVETTDTAETGEASDTAETAETADTALPLPAPCTEYAESVQQGTVVDEDLDEISGIAVSRQYADVLWVQEDHAGDPAVYAIDPTGNLLATVNLVDATNNDWEDLAIGPCGDEDCLYVAETGNNEHDREGLGVYRLPEPDPATAVDGVIDADWDFLGFVYPDENQDSEALAIAADGTPYIFTKRLDDALSRIYRYATLDPSVEVTLEYVAEFSTGDAEAGGAAAVTAADFWPDDTRAIFRTYGAVFEVDTSGGFDTIPAQTLITRTGPPEPHGEAIAYGTAEPGFWQIAEGVQPAIWLTGCQVVD